MPNTLHVRLPFGTSFALALALVSLILVSSELFARTEFAQTHLLAPSVGSPDRLLEIKLARLQQQVERDGAIDCIFLGSSVVHRGIDPTVFSQAYKTQTDKDIRCFNLGVPGMTTSTTGVLAEIVTQEYHPGLLIYGITARDYIEKGRQTAVKDVERIPWVQYRTGTFNLDGWLIDHSFAVRDYLTWRNWMQPYFLQYLHDTQSDETRILPNGFDPEANAAVNVTIPADAQSEKHFFRVLANYQISADDLKGFEKLARLQAAGVQIVIVEMPVHRSSFAFFTNGVQDYQKFVDVTRTYARADSIPFQETVALQLVPEDGWFDRGHMNLKGAQIFSRWLGQQLGSAAATLSTPIAAP